MNQQQEYKWANRDSFPSHIQQLGDPLLRHHSSENEQKAVSNLFEKILERNNAAVLRFNDASGQMQLYGLPTNRFKSFISSSNISAVKIYSSSSNFFTYHLKVGHYFGERGSLIQFGAFHDNKQLLYGMQFSKTIRTRLDNYFSCNTDNISLSWSLPKRKLYDGLHMKLFRSSRKNYFHLWDKKDSNKRVFGTDAEDIHNLKHSNLLGLTAYIQKSIANLGVKLGFDYGNRSYFIGIVGGLNYNISLGNNYELKMNLSGGDMFGQNILKNDLYFPNQKTWTGQRAKNYLSSRLELTLKQFPYLSFLGVSPYLYVQGWGYLKENERQPSVKLDGEYGVGISTSANSRLDFSLLRLSGEKLHNGPFGQIKFSF